VRRHLALHVGAGAVLAQGLVVRAHGAAVSIGNYSAILENGVVIGTVEHPVRVGQRTVFGHRAAIVGAAIGDLCEIGNGAILMPGSRLGSGCILGEGTLVPPGTVIPAGSVLVGRPPHVIRSATDADRERLAVLRQHQINLTDHPGTVVHRPTRAGEHMGTLYAYRDKTRHTRRYPDRPAAAAGLGPASRRRRNLAQGATVMATAARGRCRSQRHRSSIRTRLVADMRTVALRPGRGTSPHCRNAETLAR
jgi:carbonic anhydrase/acetyltransferase-like protein (isoleucine patch superfamily)